LDAKFGSGFGYFVNDIINKRIVSISSVILIIFFSLSISAGNNFTSFETLKEQAVNYYQEGS